MHAHSRIHAQPAAGDRRARLALPALLSGLAVTVAGALAGTPWLASVGLGVYLLGLLAHGGAGSWALPGPNISPRPQARRSSSS